MITCTIVTVTHECTGCVTVAVLRIDDVDRIAPLWRHGVIATIHTSIK